MVGRTIESAPPSAFEEAFALRRTHFPDDRITFFAPGGIKQYETEEFRQETPLAYLPISLTGSGCALDCDHCNKRILEPMVPLDRRRGLFDMCKALAERGTRAILVSGGSKKNGEVPFMNHIDDIRRVKDELGMRVMVHTGLMTDAAHARALKEAGVDGVALDIIGSNDTIREVYHLDATTEDYERSLEVMANAGLSLRPHIILGHHYGEFRGEYEALEMIARYPHHALIVVILVPLHGTKMCGVTPPLVEDVEAFFIHSRMRLPRTLIMLGCARPLGDYKQIVDRKAVDAGYNGMAFPAEGVVQYARDRGLRPVFVEDACSCGC